MCERTETAQRAYPGSVLGKRSSEIFVDLFEKTAGGGLLPGTAKDSHVGEGTDLRGKVLGDRYDE